MIKALLIAAMFSVQTTGWVAYAGEPYQVEQEVEVEKLTDEEFDLVCRVVASEARGDTFQGMMAVAETIKTRHEQWDMSVTDVCTAPSQFAKPYQGEISVAIKVAVDDVFHQNKSVFDGEYPTHFHNGTVNPYWTENKTYLGQVGGHYFYGY